MQQVGVGCVRFVELLFSVGMAREVDWLLNPILHWRGQTNAMSSKQCKQSIAIN